MKIVQINKTCGQGSTGKICVAVSKLLDDKKIENYILYSTGISDNKNSIKFCNFFLQKTEAIKKRILGNDGFGAIFSTKNLLKALDIIKPDIVHIHNIHSNDVNIEMLFSYLKMNGVKVICTFHDCWLFTGYCSHFIFENCAGYRTSCGNCTNRKKTSWFFDRSNTLQQRKIALLNSVHPLIITPSKWLAEIVNETELNKNRVVVINNGIDLGIFKPRESDFKNKNGLLGKKIVLGVAFGWSFKKGLDIFVELAGKLPEKYQIILVGTNEKIDIQLPNNVFSIHKTNNQIELAEIYSAADVFFNPTREDTFPTVNMEAIACGTPVVTFNTGGAPETVDKKTGIVVSGNSMAESIKAITDVCEKHIIKREDCIKKAKDFNMHNCFKKYIELYDMCKIVSI